MAFSKNLKRAIVWPLIVLAMIWLVFVLEQVTLSDWHVYGIAPRKTFSLRGIFLTPFLHGSLEHILSNSLPFFTLMGLILFFYPRVAISSLLMIYLGTGVLMWFFANPENILSVSARTSFHIGASGVVYGMAAFLAWIGIFRRNLKAIAIALVVVFYYGGMIWGVLPTDERVSWEGHLLGAVMGIFTAYWFRDKLEKDEERVPPSWELEPQQEERPFLSPDTFK